MNRRPYTTRFEVGYRARPHAVLPGFLFIYFPSDDRGLVSDDVFTIMSKGLRIGDLGVLGRLSAFDWKE